jgi:hypothetical protein
MGVLDIVSLLILAILIVGALFLILIVAAIPGVLAKKRHSPWAEPINVGGLIVKTEDGSVYTGSTRQKPPPANRSRFR